MRELKFRIWHKHAKHFCGNLKKYLLNIHTGELEVANYSDLYEEWYYSDRMENDYIIQQYTGMIDRNGVEVYEGDIVAEKITEEMAANGDSATVGVVYFAAGTFLIDGDGALYERVFSDSPHILEDFIVIGNIFENSELLK